MKLAKIVLPHLDNQQQGLLRQHVELRHALVERWGGYTSYVGEGGWKNDAGKVLTEGVTIYEIAMPLADVVRLRILASEVARDARQDCVMMVTPNGDVEFVKPRLDSTVDAA